MEKNITFFRLLIFLILISGCTGVHAQISSSIAPAGSLSPVQPEGMYHDRTRILSFSGGTEGLVVLKTYYGWYYDSYYELETYPLEVTPLELDNGLYTRYWKKAELHSDEEAVFWKPCTNSEGITIIPPVQKQEVFGYIVSKDVLYRIRYWLVSVPHSDQKALLQDSYDDHAIQFEIDKFIQIGSSVYTCVNGLGLRIRNFEKTDISMPEALEFNDVRVSDNGVYMVMGEPEYAAFTEENLDAAVKNHNSKRRPPREPPFEYLDLNFYYDEIERLRN